MKSDEFVLTVSYMINNKDITATGDVYVDEIEQKVYDEGNNNADITPNQATLEANLVEVMALKGEERSEEEDSDDVKGLITENVVNELRKANYSAVVLYNKIIPLVTTHVGLDQSMKNLMSMYEDISDDPLPDATSVEYKTIYIFKLIDLLAIYK